MNYLDLFAGIGGFALGAYWAGWRFDRHYFSEIDPWCCKLYQQRFPDAVPLGDITKIDGKEIVRNSRGVGRGGESRWGNGQEFEDGCSPFILSGGFPCQDLSVAGKGAGITGERSGLWFEYARLIGEIRPRYAILENVGAITRRGLDRVLWSLAEVGYSAEWSDIRASDVGAPHRRERIWIVAYPAEQRCGPRRAEPTGQSRQPGVTDGREDVSDPNDTTTLLCTDGGQLNPRWVEWLMGYPGGWTDLGDSGIALSLKSPNSFSDNWPPT
jgi:DNA (cytosine-5)-methyltransferase 1